MLAATGLSQGAVLVVILGGLAQMLVLSILLARPRHQLGRAEADLAALRSGREGAQSLS